MIYLQTSLIQSSVSAGDSMRLNCSKASEGAMEAIKTKHAKNITIDISDLSLVDD